MEIKDLFSCYAPLNSKPYFDSPNILLVYVNAVLQNQKYVQISDIGNSKERSYTQTDTKKQGQNTSQLVKSLIAYCGDAFG